MRIAIIGSGIAGNAVAYALATSTRNDVVVYEREPRPGGHSATVDIDYDGTRIAVDTGFIVYNESNYPNLTALFAHLGVATQPSDMSFAVSARGGEFEWSGRTSKVVDGLFAQRRNAVSPAYLRMLLEVVRFNRQAMIDRRDKALEGLSLGAYLERGRYSQKFRTDYLLPMGAAIWSMSPAAMLSFPAESFVAFFENHHLLTWNRPVWRTVTGGSREYVAALVKPFAASLRTGSPVVAVRRTDAGVDITDSGGATDSFDHVVFAAHSDQTLAMLADADADEQSILGGVGYRDNAVYLHRDPSLMPRRKRAWAAWNVMQADDPQADLCVTYWMNALQGIDVARPVFVTLNPPRPPDPALTFGRFTYAHPQYDRSALVAQRRLHEIQGRRNAWFCGAWTRHGFHEDGLDSGIAVAEALGARLPWRTTGPVREAAE